MVVMDILIRLLAGGRTLACLTFSWPSLAVSLSAVAIIGACIVFLCASAQRQAELLKKSPAIAPSSFAAPFWHRGHARSAAVRVKYGITHAEDTHDDLLSKPRTEVDTIEDDRSLSKSPPLSKTRNEKRGGVVARRCVRRRRRSRPSTAHGAAHCTILPLGAACHGTNYRNWVKTKTRRGVTSRLCDDTLNVLYEKPEQRLHPRPRLSLLTRW